MIQIYLAGPLFSVAEQTFNRDLRSALSSARPDVSVILPQERAPKLLKLENGFRLVFEDCLAMIDRCQVVVAILEGPDVDSGTCVELGYAHAHGKPVIGVRTDHRASEEHGMNLMVSNACTRLLRGEAANTREVADRVLAVLDQVVGTAPSSRKPRVRDARIREAKVSRRALARSQ